MNLFFYSIQLILAPLYMYAVSNQQPSQQDSQQPFDYDLHLTRIPGNGSRTLVAFHGMGSNYTIGEVIKSIGLTNDTIISFNFPDYDIYTRTNEPYRFSYGSIQEILPAIYVLKKLIIDEGAQKVDLYGFSAGGGAIINTLSILDTPTYDRDLLKIGVTKQDKKKILDVLQNGVIILDVPLKSISEIIAARGPEKKMTAIDAQYRKNKMVPIDNIENLKNLSLHFIVYFEKPDAILSNRDDDLYIERLKKFNQNGTTVAITGSSGGHNSSHAGLLNYYNGKREIEKRQYQ